MANSDVVPLASDRPRGRMGWLGSLRQAHGGHERNVLSRAQHTGLRMAMPAASRHHHHVAI